MNTNAEWKLLATADRDFLCSARACVLLLSDRLQTRLSDFNIAEEGEKKK